MNELLNQDGLILSNQYERTMETAVLPYIQERQEDKTVPGDGGKPLFCSVFRCEQAKGTAMIVHGFTENAYKYSEIIHSLLRNGFSVVAYDQRGHGRSWRDEKIKDLSLTHVGSFEEYVTDLACISRETLFSMPKPWVVFAHSMGGAVAALYIERHPEVFSRASFCAPMIAPNLGSIPKAAAKILCAGSVALGRGKERIIGSKPYDGPENFETSCATGKERFDWYNRVKDENPVYQNNGPTFSWTRQAIRVTDKILKKGEVEKIQCPVLLSTAQHDSSVMPEAQGEFISRVKQGKRLFVQGARHEIYRSNDEVLFPWWHEVLSFLKCD
ncbi:MAG: alpha/beta hydrolase [Clostridia bacterium]|nr:alpha/beta hydrolase [Clostridia bacterium]